MSISSRRSCLRAFSKRSGVRAGGVSAIFALACRAVGVTVKPVESRRDLGRFIKLPWRLYRNEPRWVPPLISERKRFLDPARNPFFEHAEAQYYLAWRDSEPVGR